MTEIRSTIAKDTIANKSGFFVQFSNRTYVNDEEKRVAALIRTLSWVNEIINSNNVFSDLSLFNWNE